MREGIWLSLYLKLFKERHMFGWEMPLSTGMDRGYMPKYGYSAMSARVLWQRILHHGHMRLQRWVRWSRLLTAIVARERGRRRHSKRLNGSIKDAFKSALVISLPDWRKVLSRVPFELHLKWSVLQR